MIVITGASDGLGLQLAKVFKEAGKTVINISRRPSKYADHNIAADLTDDSAITKVANEISAMDETIEVLINNAGVLSFRPLDQVTAAEVERVFATNIKAPMLLVGGLADRLRTDRSDIINISSTVGLKAYPEQAAYGSSKWAMRGFSQNLQVELKDTNRVVSFCIGGFKSKIAEKVTGQPLADPENWMDPEDIAQFVKQIVELPKNMEVTEIVIKRREGKA